MSDPFIPVSSQNGLEVPWDMIIDGMDAPQAPTPQTPTMPPVRQYPSRPQRNNYKVNVNGECTAKEVVLECPPSAINNSNRYAQPTGGTSPLSFFVG